MKANSSFSRFILIQLEVLKVFLGNLSNRVATISLCYDLF